MNTLNITTTDRVMLVEMDRPESLNAFSTELMDELADAFLAATSDDAVKVLVLTGAGRAFSAGADLKEMGSTTTARHGFSGLLNAIIEFPKPFLVAVNGLGAGIGATICGLADVAYMARSARLRCPFSSLGLTAEAASTYTFPRLMGRQNASWFLLSGEWMDADGCKSSGLVMEVIADEEIRQYALNQAGKLARLPMQSLITTKSLIMAPLKDQLHESAEAENRALARLVGKPANQEALNAFRDKREPDFSEL